MISRDNVVQHDGRTTSNRPVRVARITAFVVGAIAIRWLIGLSNFNVAFLVALAICGGRPSRICPSSYSDLSGGDYLPGQGARWGLATGLVVPWR